MLPKQNPDLVNVLYYFTQYLTQNGRAHALIHIASGPRFNLHTKQVPPRSAGGT